MSATRIISLLTWNGLVCNFVNCSRFDERQVRMKRGLNGNMLFSMPGLRREPAIGSQISLGEVR
jgi:hypothetical protein